MEKIKGLYARYKHGIPMLAYVAVYLSWFAYLEKTVTRHYQVIHVAVDDHIPFLEIFIVPYLLWFLYIAGVVLYFFFKDKTDYRKTCIFLFTGMTIFLLISTLWPNGHHLRPVEFPRDNIFTHMVASLYQTDTPTNLWPSIHVYNSLGAHFAIMKSRHLAGHKIIRAGSLVLCISIVLSTMFLKQHSVYDVVTAFVMAGVMYSLVYRYDILLAYRTMRARRKAKPQVG